MVVKCNLSFIFKALRREAIIIRLKHQLVFSLR